MNGQRVGLVVVAAGSSRRMGGIDKVWAALAGIPIVEHSLKTFVPRVDAAVLVVRAADLERAAHHLGPLFPDMKIVAGGAERQESVDLGLQMLPEVDMVAVHDAARPLASIEMLSNGLALLDRFDGAIPAVPVHDTIKRVRQDGVIEATVDRSNLRAVQTPQVFRARMLRAVHAEARGRHLVTDDAGLVEARGGEVTVFAAPASNFKITTRVDLAVAECLLAQGLPE